MWYVHLLLEFKMLCGNNNYGYHNKFLSELKCAGYKLRCKYCASYHVFEITIT